MKNRTYSMTKSAIAKRVAKAKAATVGKNGKPLSMTTAAIATRVSIARNPDRFKSKQNAWRKANSEQINSNMRARYAANPEKAKAKNKAWYAANSEKVAAYYAEHHATGFKLGGVKVGEIRPVTKASIARAKYYAKQVAENPEEFYAKKRASNKAWYDKNRAKALAGIKASRLRKQRRAEIAERNTTTDKDGNV